MDTLKIAADSLADTLARIAQNVPDGIDWVQECMYRHAMLIERINLWMDIIAAMFWICGSAYVLCLIVGGVFDFRKKNKKPNQPTESGK